MQKKGRTIFIGDIHGCYDEFQLLIKKLNIQKEDKVYCVGDLINKGPKSFEMLEFLYIHKKQYKCILGNNELQFVRYIDGIDDDNISTQYIELRQKINEEKTKLINFLRKLPKYIEKENFILIHAGIISNKLLKEHSVYEVSSGKKYNGRPWYIYYKGNKKVIYGHWATEGLQIRDKTIGIDSGCVFGGTLSAYILETSELIGQDSLNTYTYPNYKKKGLKLEKIREIYKNFEKLKNKKIAVLGFGKEGQSTLNFLKRIGCEKIIILDKKKHTSPQPSPFRRVSSKFPLSGKERGLGGEVSGKKYLDNLGEYDLIFKTPGISIYDEKIQKYKDKITSQAKIFFKNYTGKVIGVTATKGKSTISTLIYKTLKQAGYNTKLVGNIGTPVLDEVDILHGETYDYIIYELSSYTLETLEPKCFIAVFGNLFECHLKWHKNSFEIYKQAKLNIITNSENIIILDKFKYLLKCNGFAENFCKYKIILILYTKFCEFIKKFFPCRDRFKTCPYGKRNNTKIYSYKQNIYTYGKNGDFTYKENKFFIKNKKKLEEENILLLGEHNRENITSVIGILEIIAQSSQDYTLVINNLFKSLKKVLKKFKGLKHRLENIGTYKEIIFIDDAISVTQESTIAAIDTFKSDIGTIFLGGESGIKDFSKLREKLKQYNIENIVLFPDSGNIIFEEKSKKLKLEEEVFLKGYGDYKPKVYKTKSIKNAVGFAYKNTKKGKICILSSASPSYNLWKSFEEKGNLFQKEVKKLK